MNVRDGQTLDALERLRRQRHRLAEQVGANHDELVAELRRGYEQRLPVTHMADAAGISRATAHRLLKGGELR